MTDSLKLTPSLPTRLQTAAPVGAAPAVAAAPAVKLGGDRLTLGTHAHHAHHDHKKSSPEPQSKYGIKLTPADRPYAEGLKKFEAYSRAGIEHLAAVLRNDPAFKQASDPETWKKMTVEQKQAYANHVARLEGAEFNYRPAQVVLKRFTGKDKNDFGGFESETDKLTVNSAPDKVADFKEFTETIVHEEFHAYQDRLEKGTFAKDDPRFAAKHVYKHNEDHYHGDPYKAYRSQPLEAHAFMAEQHLGAVLFGDSKE